MLIAVSTIFGPEIIVAGYQDGEGEQPVEELEDSKRLNQLRLF
ncbi:MAG: hypothetical protein PHE67_05335 [Campylobacterales bacterium]|nr:hypothetical protein [Campylobacterales bacterium]